MIDEQLTEEELRSIGAAHLSRDELRELGAALFWAMAREHPEETAARLGCGLVRPSASASTSTPRRRTWRNPGGNATARTQKHMRRLRRQR